MHTLISEVMSYILRLSLRSEPWPGVSAAKQKMCAIDFPSVRGTSTSELHASGAQHHEMCSGMQNNVEQAKTELKLAMKSTAATKQSVAGTIALASILFQQKKFNDAHRYYCQVNYQPALYSHALCSLRVETMRLSFSGVTTRSHCKQPSLVLDNRLKMDTLSSCRNVNNSEAYLQ